LPSTYTLADLGQTVAVSAVPRAADDICLNLRADAYDWTWTAADSRVDVTNNTEPLHGGGTRGLENQTATARAETGTTPTAVNSSVTQGTETITGRSDIFVSLQPPKVTMFGPNCDKACLNAAAWAQFNVPMDPASAIASNVILKRCANENCLAYDETVDLSGARVRLTPAPGSTDTRNTYFVLEPTRTAAGGGIETLLEIGRFYRITLIGGTSSGFRSLTGLPLTGLNAPDGFSWTFRVKEGDDARCAVASVNVVPGEKFENAVGNRQLFSATPVSAPDACSAVGSPLVSDRSYAWSIDQTSTVSRYINGGTGSVVGAGLIDTASSLPAGCSGRCTPLGAGGLFGHVASCGNGIVETTDGHYCSGGHTPFGEPCTLLAAGSKGGEECDDATSACDTHTCLWKPSTVTPCGNGHLDRGEQCDDGPTGSAGCSTTCQLTGARAGGSTCGNHDVAAGEACDDGNTTNGDGCNSECLHEGSTRVVAVCDNGHLDPGETCEAASAGGPLPAYCDPNTCLKLGTSPSVAGGPGCGNGTIEAGEDCDDGNHASGDGCSSACLDEGASAAYPVPSFCGDAVRGRGELCEAATGGSQPDATQLAEIVGDGTPDATGRLSSSIHTTYDSQNGLATYGLQCGYTDEASCPSGTGLDNAGCCAPRPSILAQAPAAGATNVCRNVLISGTFNVKMDEASVQANFVIATDSSGATCPAGTTLLTRIEDYDNSTGLAGFFHRLWSHLLAWLRPSTAQAALCVGATTGHLSFEPQGTGTLASFTLDHALAPSTHYQVLFRGDTNLADNGTVANRVGVKSARGVVSGVNFLWDFNTGSRICSVTAISVRDTNIDSPNLFTQATESHLYTAQSVSLADGAAVSLSPVAEYAWTWEPWIASNLEVLNADPGLGGAGTSNASNVSVASPPKNGSSFVEAGIRITNDQANVPSTTGRIVKGTQNAQVLLCQNPWPDRGTAPFAEVSGDPSLDLLGSGLLATSIRSAGPYFNFATLYCRDSGASSSTSDDLPPMNIQPVAVATGDSLLGILRQYLLTFDVPSLKSDGIGLRVATNPLHLTPSAWYASRGFKGKPEATTVDGYEAVKDGSTWYIGAVNTADATGAPVYSQIYIVSHNPDAKPETLDIANQLVANFTLNANIQSGATNACEYAVADATHSVGELYRASNGKLVRCSADWECVADNPNLLCASFKTKMQRDSKRIVDFQFMSDSLETAKGRTGSYPKLTSGSFVPTLATSRWPSWSEELRTETGVTFPTDPVNRFLTCGVCSDTGSPCQDASECGQGAACNAVAGNAGVEPATCWNATAARYSCPRLNPRVPESTSRLYQYRAVNGGQRYELSTELEGASAARYSPPLLSEIKHCSNVDSSCRVDADCDVHISPAITLHGTCNGTGGLWRYADVCGGTTYTSGDGVCGDGVVGTGEVCELGDTNPVACTTASGAAGTKLQICNDCGRPPATPWIDGPATSCVANIQCGNGRVDGGEICDDGALNGNYGHCNRTCTGYDAYCGDARLSPGESCDLGSANGAYCRSGCDAALSCNLSCTGQGPRCGDNHVDEGFEQCDGNSQQSPSAICVGGTNASNTCTTDSDCPGSTCGGTPSTATCVGVTARRCSNAHDTTCALDSDCPRGTPRTPTSEGTPDGRCITYPTARTRTCVEYGHVGGVFPRTILACNFNGWSDCQPVGFCGDGHVDAGEQCDDGNTSNNDSCTNSCKTNVCGDGFVQTGTEECDLGTTGLIATGGVPQNGTRSCTADYGSTCLSCSTSCRQVASSGGYCGNGVKEGSEQCDGAQGLGTCSGDTTRSCSVNGDCASGETCNLISCRSLGYDFAANIKCPTLARCVDGIDSFGVPGKLLAVYPPSDFLHGDPEGACTDPSMNGTFIPASATPIEIPISNNNACVPGQPKTDVLTCAPACSLTGCQRCVDAVGTGVIAGQVLDAMNYTYPVPNARVTLYNNGLQIGSPTYTDGDGYFSIHTLSTIQQCSNYHIVVDSYVDNPCTGADPHPGLNCLGRAWDSSLGVADEGVYGGYWPFTSHNFGVSTFLSAGLDSATATIYLVPRVGVNETLVVAQFNGAQAQLQSALILPKGGAFAQTTGWDSVSSVVRAQESNKYSYASCLLDTRDGQKPGITGFCTGPSSNFGGPAVGYIDQSHPCTADSQCSVSGGFGGGCYKAWGCVRQIMNPQGRTDLDQVPHSELVCRNTVGGVITPSCFHAQTAPFVYRFKINPDDSRWFARGNSGFVNFFMVDNQTDNAPPSYQYLSSAALGLQVTIVTHDSIYHVTPPSPSSAPCTPHPSPFTTSERPSYFTPPATTTNPGFDVTTGSGKFWLAFQENVQTGAIDLKNQFLCRGDTIPGEDTPSQPPDNAAPGVTGSSTYPLPWPLYWQDSKYDWPR
jgi:cysteine-rich repeat protein